MTINTIAWLSSAVVFGFKLNIPSTWERGKISFFLNGLMWVYATAIYSQTSFVFLELANIHTHAR